MNISELLEKVKDLPAKRMDVPTTPPVELVALVIRWNRNLRQWKASTLADFARVSLSTIERVERGERVSEEVLDKIARALGYEKGAFTAPRLPNGDEQVAEDFMESFGYLEAVSVTPMKTQRAVREAVSCQAFLIHRPGVPATYDDQISNLTEWLDFASFVLSDLIDGGPSDISRRKLYEDILSCIRELEHRGLTILSGVLHAPQRHVPDWKVAVLSITPKLTDPGAIKRRQVMVDRRNLGLNGDNFTV